VAGGARDAGQIWDINTPMLSVLLDHAGVEILRTAHGSDDRAGLARQLEEMAASADLVVTTGGLSVGEEDHVKPALGALGGDIVFSGVTIKPGKPVSFGRIGPAFWPRLPGNPLSAFMTWALFGTVLVRGLNGETAQAQRRHVVTATAIRRKPGRGDGPPARTARRAPRRSRNAVCRHRPDQHRTRRHAPLRHGCAGAARRPRSRISQDRRRAAVASTRTRWKPPRDTSRRA